MTVQTFLMVSIGEQRCLPRIARKKGGICRKDGGP